jgi:23S rRNA (guanosine2251-2'-O)-methyltransferase
MRQIILIAHNLRSTHNIGSLLRTADGLGVQKVYLTGYTPYPLASADGRLPHLAQKINRQISKTALGAEDPKNWEHADQVEPVIAALKTEGFRIVAIEQAQTAISLSDYAPPEKLALLVGREVEGVEPEILALCDDIIEIPMFGDKESYNVVQAAAMALYHCRFQPAASN